MLRNGVKMPMLVVLYLAAFVSAFNENIMNVALVAIASEFSVDASLTQWLVTGYMIVTAVIIAIGAFLTERFSLRGLFFVAGACLVAGEVVCFVAPTFPILLVGRLVQAVASGLFIPLMMNTVLASAPGDKMGSYLSIGSAAITLGPAIAPVESGVVVTLFGWRSIFVFPAIFTFALLLAGTIVVRSFAPTREAHCDAPSVALAAVGLTLFVYGLGQITASIIVAIAFIVVGIAAIAWFIRRQKGLGTPVLDVRPLASTRFLLASLLMMVSMMTSFSMSVLLPLYYEGAFLCTALAAGLFILPPIVVNALVAVLAGRIMDRAGEWPLLPVGFACIVAGQALIAALSPSLSMAAVIGGSIVVYAGVGLVMSPSQTSGLRLLSPELHASGVAILNVLIMVAASIGPSLFVGIVSSGAAGAEAAGVSTQLAQASGFSQAIVVATVIGAVGLVVSVPFAWRSRSQQLEDTGAPAQEATITELMNKDPNTVAPEATVREALSLVLERGTSGVTVVSDDNRVIGILSDGDVMRALSSDNARVVNLAPYLSAYEGESEFSERVKKMLDAMVTDLATEKVICVSEASSLQDACDLFYRHRLKRLPVVDDEGRLVGLLERKAISRYLMERFIA